MATSKSNQIAHIPDNISVMTSTVGGLVPTPPNDATKFLNGAGVFSTPVSSQVWVTKTANYTAVAGDAIRANTSGGAFPITLPAAPVDNDTVSWKDYAGTFGTNKLTFARNGKNIMGLAEDMDVTASNFNGTLTFIAATNDWRW